MIQIGSLVEFYDANQAFADRDFSGEDPEHYKIGTINDIYDKCSHLGQINRLCDIIADGKLYTSHFVDAVKLVTV